MAISSKMDKRENKVVVLLSDGECDEGEKDQICQYRHEI
jgi:transketolase N-terminal domain/subunit